MLMVSLADAKTYGLIDDVLLTRDAVGVEAGRNTT
jgi:ATP-dependent protease ClpP protease subunit